MKKIVEYSKEHVASNGNCFIQIILCDKIQESARNYGKAWKYWNMLRILWEMRYKNL